MRIITRFQRGQHGPILENTPSTPIVKAWVIQDGPDQYKQHLYDLILLSLWEFGAQKCIKSPITLGMLPDDRFELSSSCTENRNSSNRVLQ